ncbi:metallophosphoesterase family protein [Schleiferilactobacillus harbinensis]|nr:metallophosphoesterase family protein [Schleiferilactobacillus harbinensis]
MIWTKGMTDRAINLTDQGYTHAKVAAVLSNEYSTNITGNAVRKRLKRAHHSEQPAEASVQFNDDGTQTATALFRLKHEPDKSPETLMRLCGYDPDKFDMVSGDYKVYEQHSTKDGTVPQYSIHVRVKPKSSINVQELVTILNKGVKPITVKQISNGDRNLVIPLFDLHFGITTFNTLEPELDELCDIIQHGYDRIAIEVGGDLLHSDYMGKTQTVRGTQLDHADTVRAWQDAKWFLDDLIEQAITYCNHVSIYAVGGNHDFDMQWAFVEGLADRYDQVTVHNTIHYRQAFQIGHVGILMAHGDVALKKLPMLFANEDRDVWANTKWREIHYGHFHHEVVNDDSGVIMRQMGTPKPADGYEAKNGYTMAHKVMQAFEYSDDQLKVTYNIGGETDE